MVENLPEGEHVYLYVEDSSGAQIRLRLDPAEGPVVQVPRFPVGEIHVVQFQLGIWGGLLKEAPFLRQTYATAQHAGGGTTRIVVAE